MSYLWAELEERLLCRTAFAFGGLSLFFFFLFDNFCFSSEELWVGQGGQKFTLSVPLKCKKCYRHCKTKGWWSPINTIFKESIGATGVRLTTKSQSLSHKTFFTEWTVPGQEQSSNAHTIAYEAGQIWWTQSDLKTPTCHLLPRLLMSHWNTNFSVNHCEKMTWDIQ